MTWYPENNDQVQNDKCTSNEDFFLVLVNIHFADGLSVAINMYSCLGFFFMSEQNYRTGAVPFVCDLEGDFSGFLLFTM